MDIFHWQLSLCSEGQGSIPTCQEDSKESVVTPDTTEESVATSPFDKDIQVLTEKYGELCPAKEIVIDLDTACELLGRDRHRVDAFTRLQRYLFQQYQVNLRITSRKTH